MCIEVTAAIIIGGRLHLSVAELYSVAMTPTRLRISAALACATLTAVCGCTGYRDPAIRVTRITPGIASDEAMTVDIHLELVNPNDASLRLADFNYQMNVNGQRVYSGVRSAEATLAASERRTLTIPAVISFDDVPAARDGATVDYAVRGSLQYLTPGELMQILLDIGWRKPRARFSETGTMQLSPDDAARTDADHQ